ncbi:uncharacterized protein LOC123511743 isoform X2 [Portunus trituberculatus]|nr:uncharacterized protein LOC123511743 isoform X2 [Portunus trituberculatus]XP_045123857.1 uncharacterized protein LOC123511743 isoform X2 [Portunus trituberculatus]
MVRVTTPQPGQVTLHNLTLPHGSYQVKVFKRVDTGELDGLTDSTPAGGGGRGRLIVRKHHFLLPTKRRRERILVRNRRHKMATSGLEGRKKPGLSNTELILQNLSQLQYSTHRKHRLTQHKHQTSHTTPAGVEGTEGGPCVCCKCFSFSLNYNNMTAVLTFNYSLTESCQPACSTVNVQLYREGQSLSTAHQDTEKPGDPLMGSERIGRDKNVTQGPIQYSNIDTGCYYVELKPHLYPLPERTMPLCVAPLINVTDMEAWDPYFSLEPNPHRQSLTVRWMVGEQFNFSSYDLTLHHHPSLHINCTGTAIFPNMSIIPQNRLEVRQSVYTFHNLSSGWYCARVTPLDDRCPLDGCHVVSSPAQFLLEPADWKCEAEEECDDKGGLGLTLLVVGCVVGAVVTGVTLAWAILYTWPSITQVFSSATHYSPVPIRSSVHKGGGHRRQVVLLVWTPQDPHSAKFVSIITAFKTLLRTYGHCEVYDYLELSSLPERQQLHLLASPTTWLDSILAQHSIKIIMVASEGAWQRQLEWKQPDSGMQKASVSLLSTSHNALDQLLFPYLLRRLHDQPDLAGDYSRLFHVRFSEVSHSAVELSNLVSWKRFKIPEHIRSLAVSLHGGVAASAFEEPSEEQLRDLQAALSAHPQHCSHLTNGTTLPWPTAVTCNGNSALGNGTART